MTPPHCRLPLWLILVIVPAGLTNDRAEAAESDSPPRTWAVAIGVEQYEKAPPLRYTVNDVRQIVDSLVQRGTVLRANVLEITDSQSAPDRQPRKEPLMARLQEWLAKPNEQDTIIVYFSGHGFRDADGKLYLAPLDCDPADPAPTGIPVEWFRGQLAQCKAQFKLLILDACHAGSEKGEDRSSIEAGLLGQQFEDLDRVLTIASSKASEKSQIWLEKEQSLFSYWLVQALKGHADTNDDGRVDTDELYRFVSNNVTQTAGLRFPRPQTPVRIVRAGIEGIPAVVTLRPQPLKTALADVADQLAYALEERKLTKVGVIEFLHQTLSGDEELGKSSFGKYCAEELERQLMDRAGGKYSVIDRRRVRDALKKSRFELQDLSNSVKLASLSKSLDDTPVLVTGTLVSRQGQLVFLRCKLQQTKDDTDLGVSAGGTAALTESEWGMLGRSAVVRPEDRRPEYRPADQVAERSSRSPVESPVNTQVNAQVINRMDERAESPRSHPFQDPTFPFRVRFQVNGQERKGEFRGNDYFVAVHPGEKYELMVENNSGDVVLMRLLVDGLNTLPEKETGAKGIIAESWGMHVNLEEARAWVLDPQGEEVRGKKPEWRIPGWATKSGDKAFREFVIVDVQDSLAGRQGLGDEAGDITAAFYRAKSGSRGGRLGTGAGAELDINLKERPGLAVGTMLGVVHIKYVERAALDSTRD